MSTIADLELVKCTGLLTDNYVGHLAYIANNEPHVVPSTYFLTRMKRVFCVLHPTGIG